MTNISADFRLKLMKLTHTEEKSTKETLEDVEEPPS